MPQTLIKLLLSAVCGTFDLVRLSYNNKAKSVAQEFFEFVKTQVGRSTPRSAVLESLRDCAVELGRPEGQQTFLSK